MSKKNVIAIIGQMGSGKTTLANKLVKEFSNIEKKSFATPLKEIAVEILGRPINKEIDRKFLQHLSEPLKMDFNSNVEYSEIFYDYCQSIKKLSQLSGVDEIKIYNVVSKYDSSPQFFTEQFLDFSNNHLEIVALDDMRFLEVEYKVLKNRCNLYTVLLDTDLEICKQRIIERDGSFDDKWLEHKSEQEFKDIPFNFCIHNNDEKFEKILIDKIAKGQLFNNSYPVISLNELQKLRSDKDLLISFQEQL